MAYQLKSVWFSKVTISRTITRPSYNLAGNTTQHAQVEIHILH